MQIILTVASFRNSSAQFFKPACCCKFSKLCHSLVNILLYFSLPETVLRECLSLLFFHRVCGLIVIKLWLICRKCSKNWILGQILKRKSISDSRSVGNISDKRLRTEVQPAQTNEVERAKRFVNVLLRWIVSNLIRINKISKLAPEKVSADAHGCTDFDLILGS